MVLESIFIKSGSNDCSFLMEVPKELFPYLIEA